jgi:putative transposase
MPHSFTQIFMHYVFAPKSRFHILTGDKPNFILDYMAGICKNYDCHLECGFINPDHVHLLINLPAKHSVAEIRKSSKPTPAGFSIPIPKENPDLNGRKDMEHFRAHIR